MPMKSPSMVDQLTTGDHTLVSSQYYDGLGRKSSTAVKEGAGQLITTTFSYDQRSRENQVSNPYRSSVTGYTTKAFDGISRVTSVTAPDGSSKTTMKYAGTLVLTADAQNINRQTKTDGAGRLIQVVENQLSFNGSGVAQASGCPSGVSCNYTTNYQYDPLDDLISVNQQDPNTGIRENRTFSYDWLKRLTAATNPETGMITYQYDQSNNLSQKTDNRGTTTTFSTYDGLNRPVQKTYTDGTPSVHYCYDGQLYTSGSCSSSSVTGQKLGHLTYIGNSNSSKAFTNFLNRGLIGTTVQTTFLPSFTLAPLTFTYLYTLTGNLSSETYPSGKTITTSYDSADRIENVSRSTSLSYATLNADPTQAYTPDGQIQNVSYGSGVTEQRSYDPQMLLPTGVTVQNSAGALLNLGLGYSPAGSNNGNIMRQTIGASSGLPQSLTQNYSYDPESRISTILETAGGGINQGFLYDAFGNMALMSGALNTQAGHTPTATGAATLPFNKFNQWTMACTTPPCYDAAGNQTAVAGDVYSFDGENRMTAANVMATGDTTYGYDGAGQRVWKTNVLGATVYAYDAGGELAAEYSTIAPSSSGTQYLSTDQLGSTRMITDASGTNVVSRYDYVPFGQEIPSGMDGRGTGYGAGVYPSSPDVQDKKFTGKERDAETGLDYFGARYFSGAQGRFTSPDWSAKPTPVPYADLTDPQTLNLYGYVRNNPLRRADIDGHQGPPEEESPEESEGELDKLEEHLRKVEQSRMEAAREDFQKNATDEQKQAADELFKNINDSHRRSDPEFARMQDEIAARSEEARKGAQDKKLSNSEVKTLEKNTGQDVHDIKGDVVGNKNVSKHDLYKTKDGDIVVKPKGGGGSGEPTGYTTEHLKKVPGSN